MTTQQRRDQLRGLIDQYWDIAYREGSDGATHDTEEGSAQECRSEIERIISQLGAAQAQQAPQPTTKETTS